MSKVIDYDRIVRESFIRAQRDLGILKEQVGTKTSAFMVPFDRQKHMPAFQFKPTEWGLKGTTDANQIDAIIAAIVGATPASEQDNLAKFKEILIALNKNLGIEASAYAGQKNVPESEQKTSNLKEIIASLQLKNLLSSIISQDPNAAGKIFEGLVARMVGGYANNPDDNPIEDFVDGEGNYISLKTIKSTTEVKGSKTNLAKAIARKGAVTYLVCIKDAQKDPFKLKTFSFKINQDNFFYFINGVSSSSDLTPALKARIKTDINTIYGALGLAELKEAKKPEKDISVEEPETGILQADIINKYFEQEGDEFSSKDLKEKEKEFKRRLIDVIQAINIDSTQEEYYNRAVEFYRQLAPKFVSTDANWKASYNDIKNNMFFKKEDADPFKAVTWNSLDYIARVLRQENDRFALAALFDTNSKIRQIAEEVYFKLKSGAKFGNDEEYNKLLAHVTEKHADYVTEKNKLANRFNPFVDFVEKIHAALKKAKLDKLEQDVLAVKPNPLSAYMANSISAGKTPQEDSIIQKELDVFWDKVKNASQLSSLEEADDPEETPETDKSKEKKQKKETQFELGVATVRAFAMQNKEETNYDDTYPDIIVARAELFNSAKKNGELFEKWAEPIYESMHYLTQGINRYFLEDDISGLSSEADKNTNMPGAILAAEQLATDTKDIASKGLKASELTEKKNNLNNLTKEARIVMEMLQRMEE